MILRYSICKDLPLNALIFHILSVSGRRADQDSLAFVDPTGAYDFYGEEGWTENSFDITDAAFVATGGAGYTLTGVGIVHESTAAASGWTAAFS